MESAESYTAVRPSQFAAALHAAIAAGLPVYVEGPPGGGKSSIIKQVAHKAGLTLHDIRCSLHDPVDFLGVPSVIKHSGHQRGTTVFNPPDFLPTVGPCMLFFDEFSNAAQAVQSACLQIWLNKRLNNWTLPDDSIVVGAGNRVQDRAGASRLLSSLRSRAIMLELIPDIDDWVRWALDEDLDIRVIAFCKARPELLSQFDPAATVSPDPRGWERVSKLLPHLSADVRLPMLAGIVSAGPATELIAFMDLHDHLPDPDEIILDPEHAPVPPISEPAALYAVALALARKASPQSAPAIYTYAERFPSEEYAALCVQEAIRVDRNGMVEENGRAFAEFTSRHQSLFTGRVLP